MGALRRLLDWILRMELQHSMTQQAPASQIATSAQNEDTRIQFLLRMYDAAWANISRTDDTIWKLYTSYTALVVGSVVLTDKLLQSPFYGILAVHLITAVAVLHSFNVNAWFLRNLVIITNVEAEFLQPSDYGRIIPRGWHPPYGGPFFYWDELPTILGSVYVATAALLTVAYWKRMTPDQQHMSLGFAALLLFMTFMYVCRLKNRFERLKTDAPGKPRG